MEISQIASNLRKKSSHKIIYGESQSNQISNNQGILKKSTEKEDFELNLISGFQIQNTVNKFPSKFLSKRFLMKIVRKKLITC